MSEQVDPGVTHGGSESPVRTIERVRRGLRRRHRAERRFRLYGLAAILLGIGFVSILFVDIVGKGYPAFQQTFVRLDVQLDPDTLGVPTGASSEELSGANYQGAVRAALRGLFPDVSGRGEKRELYGLISSGASFDLRSRVLDDPDLLGHEVSLWVPANDDVDQLYKHGFGDSIDAAGSRLSSQQIDWLTRLVATDRVELRFNTVFFTNGDSREPELAGIRGALMGSFFTLVVTLLLSFPLGVAAAIYLEEFAPRNRITDLIEININNLAAVPSIVFGLLGLAVFINIFGFPRSAPLVGGLVLTLMTLPTIIIASRAALKSVPPSVREAALGVGASPVQAVFHHVMPLAMPGMLTGTIIGMAQALGETAPLLMIGMIAFIVDIPGGFTDPSTVLPVQIYLWADSPERAFVERTSAAILVLLGFLIVMNTVAVVLRKRFERRW